MNDLISRKAALDVLKALEEPAPTAQHVSAIFDCEDAIRNLPSVQLKMRGKWVRRWKGTIAEGLFCNVCGKHGYGSDFCPNCGSDNRGGKR